MNNEENIDYHPTTKEYINMTEDKKDLETEKAKDRLNQLKRKLIKTSEIRDRK